MVTGATAQAHEAARLQRPRADGRGAARFAACLQARRTDGIAQCVGPLMEWQHRHEAQLYDAGEGEDKGRLAIRTMRQDRLVLIAIDAPAPEPQPLVSRSPARLLAHERVA